MSRMSSRARMLGVAISAATLATVLGVSTVMAGEITGTGGGTPLAGASECKYSGLNDTPDAAFPFGGRVQSYGQYVRYGLKGFVDGFTGGPWVACNPTSGG